MERFLDDMAGMTNISKLYMFAGHWKVQVEECMQEFATFTWKCHSFWSTVSPFGLMNMTAILLRMAALLLVQLRFVKIYIYKVVEDSDSVAEPIVDMIVVFNRIRRAGWKVIWNMCYSAKKSGGSTWKSFVLCRYQRGLQQVSSCHWMIKLKSLVFPRAFHVLSTFRYSICKVNSLTTRNDFRKRITHLDTKRL